MSQKKLDKEMKKMGASKYWSSVSSSKAKGCESRTSYGTRMVQGIISPLSKAIKSWIQDASQRKCGQYHSSLPILKELDPEVLSILTSRVCVDSAGAGLSYTQAAKKIGALVEDECRYIFLKEKAPRLWSKLKEQVNKSTVYYRKRTIIILAMNRTNQGFESWSTALKVRVGCLLIELFIQSTGAVEVLTKRHGKHKTKAYITFNDRSLKWIEAFNERFEFADPYWMPMLDKPKEWLSPFCGGYSPDLVEECALVKTKNKHYLLNDLCSADMPVVLESVNHLQEVGWRVNRDVYAVINKLLELGHSVADLPQKNDYEYPPKPEDIDTNKEANKEWRLKAKEVVERNIVLRTKRVRISRTMYLATKFSGYDCFYFPYQTDFRGRVYCMSNFLNPQSDDMAKGLLTFAEGKQIKDEVEADWLKIHGANTWGNDRVTLEERKAWVDSIKEDVLAVAEDPYTNLWWAEASKPFQFLAWCFEWARYLKIGTGFVTHLPVSIDGSNNGLQLLSLLMRDPNGARDTNCSDLDKPVDTYGDIADRVIESLKSDADNPELASYWLDFGIDRSATKRPVMIFPYGGTAFACKEYTEQWYKEMLESKKEWSPDSAVFNLRVNYLSKHIWKSVCDSLKKPQVVMEWMMECARALASKDLPIRWKTPTGFPVLQDYKNQKLIYVSTTLGDKIKKIKLYEEGKDVNRRKQANGISPNFVHSLDAAILQEAVVTCKKAGITSLQVVHDSFGTHCTDIETLAGAVRYSIVQVFNDNLLDKLWEDLSMPLPAGESLPRPPELGDFDIKEVLNAQYMFS